MATRQKETKEEHWIRSTWRPAAAWSYLVINIFDFVIAPSITMYLKAKGFSAEHWVPLTLSNGGLVHIAYGTILGVSAFGRTQENLAKINNNDKPKND